MKNTLDFLQKIQHRMQNQNEKNIKSLFEITKKVSEIKKSHLEKTPQEFNLLDLGGGCS